MSKGRTSRLGDGQVKGDSNEIWDNRYWSLGQQDMQPVGFDLKFLPQWQLEPAIWLPYYGYVWLRGFPKLEIPKTHNLFIFNVMESLGLMGAQIREAPLPRYQYGTVWVWVSRHGYIQDHLRSLAWISTFAVAIQKLWFIDIYCRFVV